MVRKTSTPVPRAGRSDMFMAKGISPEARQSMIREAAYFRYVHRGFAHGHDLDDWLAAEADFERANPERQPLEPAATAEFELQQSGTLGPREDEALKRMIKQHPRRDIPRIESIEPDEAPSKE